MEFEAAIGYEPSKPKQEEQPLEETQDHVMEEVVETFKGSGVRLDGKKKKDNQLDAPVIKRVSFEEHWLEKISTINACLFIGSRPRCARLRLPVWLFEI